MTASPPANRKQRRLVQSEARKEARISFCGQSYLLADAVYLALQKGAHYSTYREAEELYRLVLAKFPDHVQSMNNLGYLHYQFGDIDEAIALYRRAMHTKRDYYIAYYNLGEALLAKGEMQEAEQLFLKTLAMKSNVARSLFSLARMRSYTTIDNEEVRQIHAILDTQGAAAEDKQYLYFALGKIYDECGHYDEAFAYYRLANDILKASIKYDPARIEYESDSTIKTYSRDFLARGFPSASESEAPVFIVGMPRSGTTLLASILSNHPQVGSAGELLIMQDMVRQLPTLLGVNLPYVHAAKHMTPEAVSHIISAYEKGLWHKMPKRKRYVIDKHPVNFYNLGLISILFPKARIIHCTRDPMDTCLSNYFQYFNNDYDYSFDLLHTGHYYSQYVKIMAHWRNALPIEILDVSYEDTITNMEKNVRRILDFLNLEWDERCLAPHTNRNPVKTSSLCQVRKPVYHQSIQRWRHYEKHLEPLKNAMKTFA